MAYNTYADGIALDRVTMRGLPVQPARITDTETGDLVEAFTMGDDPQPVVLATNAYGYFPQFQTLDTHRHLTLTFGRLSLQRIAFEVITGALDAATAAAVAAAASATAAANSASLVGAPADAAIKFILDGPTTLTRVKLDALYMGKGSLGLATSAADGLMPKADKAKLDAATTAATAGTIAVRGTGGRLTVGTPTASTDAATKAYSESATNLLSGTVPVARLPLATTAVAGAISAADKTRLDAPILAYKAKLATDNATTYPAGYSTGLFAAGDGWPHPSFSQVVTFSPPGYTGGTTQWAYAYTDSSRPPMYRSATSATGNPWGPWKTISAQGDNSLYNVRDYGALGNGTTDDTAAVQAAIDALAAAGGGTLLMPPATYIINSQIRLQSGVQVSGYGATIKKTGTGYLIFTTSSLGSTGYGSGARKIAIRGLTFESNFAGNQALVNALHHAEDVILEDLTFNGAVRDGHCFDLMGCRRVAIRRCVFRGRIEVVGRLYVEAVQIDHSARSNAGGELTEAAASWDGLPCLDITMEDCHAEPWIIGGTTYLAPRLIGGHSRIAARRHRNITINNVSITDSGPTAADGQYQGWIHFIHAEQVTITNPVFINTRGDAATAIGFQGVTNTYPLDSVALSSPPLDSNAGSVSCSDITIINPRFKGFRSTTALELIMVYGLASAPLERATVDVATATDCHPGTLSMFDAGATLVGGSYVIGLSVNHPNASMIRRVLNAESCTNVSLSNPVTSKVAGAVFRAVSSTNISLGGVSGTETNSVCYFTGCDTVSVSSTVASTAQTGSLPYDSMFAFTGCTGVSFNGNQGKMGAGVQFVRMVNFYGSTISSSANSNMGRSFPAVVRVASDSTCAVVGTVAY